MLEIFVSLKDVLSIRSKSICAISPRKYATELYILCMLYIIKQDTFTFKGLYLIFLYSKSFMLVPSGWPIEWTNKNCKKQIWAHNEVAFVYKVGTFHKSTNYQKKCENIKQIPIEKYAFNIYYWKYNMCSLYTHIYIYTYFFDIMYPKNSWWHIFLFFWHQLSQFNLLFW